MGDGEQATEMEVTTGPDTVTIVLPEIAEFCTEVAVMVAVPGDAGVNTPAGLIAPGLTPQVYAELNAPVPSTAAVHVEVCVMEIEAGEHVTVTEVMVEAAGGTAVPPPPQPAMTVKATAAEIGAIELHPIGKTQERRAASAICIPFNRFCSESYSIQAQFTAIFFENR